MIQSQFPIRVRACIVALLISGCGGNRSAPPGAKAGASSGKDPDGGRNRADAIASGSDAAAVPSDTAQPLACVETPTPRVTGGTVVTVAVTVGIGERPLVWGKVNDLGNGLKLTPSDLRFYISEPEVSRTGGEVVAADLVDAAGKPIPYGVQLVNLEDSDSLTFHLRVPPGAASGLRFTLGLNDGCNTGNPDTRKAPLSASSQMTWPPPSGYLFLRWEGVPGGNSTASNIPSSIHMGGLPGVLMAPAVRADMDKPWNPAQASSIQLRLDLNQLSAAAHAAADSTGLLPADPASEAGEHVRQNAFKYSLFSLTPLP